MNKELTPLEALERYGYHCNHYVSGKKDYEIIEKALKEYENCKDLLGEMGKQSVDYAINTEKKLKALEIIKEKNVDVFGLICCIKLNEYTALETYNLKENCHNYKLTQQEFDLLKEVLL